MCFKLSLSSLKMPFYDLNEIKSIFLDKFKNFAANGFRLARTSKLEKQYLYFV